MRERLKAGDSDDAGACDFLVDRYGEFVLLRPRAVAAYAAPVGAGRSWCCWAASCGLVACAAAQAGIAVAAQREERTALERVTGRRSGRLTPACRPPFQSFMIP